MFQIWIISLSKHATNYNNTTGTYTIKKKKNLIKVNVNYK
jgi:hypothetical protein